MLREYCKQFKHKTKAHADCRISRLVKTEQNSYSVKAPCLQHTTITCYTFEYFANNDNYLFKISNRGINIFSELKTLKLDITYMHLSC